MTDKDRIKLIRAETAYEDYVISLMAGKTSEQVDEMEVTPEHVEKAEHFLRNIRMFGRLDPEELEQNYLEEIIKNGPDIREFEAEIEYRKKYGEDPAPDPSKIYTNNSVYEHIEYGGGDGLIEGILTCADDAGYQDDDSGIQLDVTGGMDICTNLA